MTHRWSEADLSAVRDRLRTYAGRPVAAVKSKYKNQHVTFQGMLFDSKKELQTYKDLEAQRLCGAIRAVVRQVSIPLPNSTRRVRIDFMLVENTGKIRWLDAKGFLTPGAKSKYQQVREAYGIEVELC